MSINIRLSGGIGNQMFQYALGVSIAESKNQKLKLDTSLFGSYPLEEKRQYGLRVFGINNNFSEKKDIDNCLTNSKKLIEKIRPYYKRSYVKQRGFGFDPNVFNVKDNVCLHGYWQSEKYFNKVKDKIKEVFSYRDRFKKINKELLSRIDSVNSVAIHIRRGDYISNKNTLRHHGVLSLDYYHKSVELLNKQLKNPNYYIFSDDIKWAKNNMLLKSPTKFISSSQNNPVNDLHLISYCDHQIIANSTFSWWGAWLNINPEKIVIAPNKWFSSDKYSSEDLIPSRWTKL